MRTASPGRARHMTRWALAALAVATLVVSACSTPSDQAASSSSTDGGAAVTDTGADDSASATDTGAADDTADDTSSDAPEETSAPVNEGPFTVAYLSFAVANSFDAPMLAAAQAVAADNNVKITVFDANNDPQTQYSQLQDVITSKKYDGIITQPIFGTGLVDLVTEAINQGIKVVNINQILGPDLTTNEPQIEGLSGNVTLIPTEIGRKLGEQTVAACASKSLDPCVVGYLYDIKASALDVAIHDGFTQATADSPVTVVAEGESFFTATVALGAVQDMLSAHSDIDLIVGSDQGIQGAVQALDGVGKTGQVLLVGYGASAVGVAAVAAGDWFSTVAMTPASEGRLGMQALVKAMRDGVDSGAVDPAVGISDDGIITADNASEFTAEWPG